MKILISTILILAITGCGTNPAPQSNSSNRNAPASDDMPTFEIRETKTLKRSWSTDGIEYETTALLVSTSPRLLNKNLIVTLREHKVTYEGQKTERFVLAYLVKGVGTLEASEYSWSEEKLKGPSAFSWSILGWAELNEGELITAQPASKDGAKAQKK